MALRQFIILDITLQNLNSVHFLFIWLYPKDIIFNSSRDQEKNFSFPKILSTIKNISAKTLDRDEGYINHTYINGVL